MDTKTKMSPREVTAIQYRAAFERVFADEIRGAKERTVAYYVGLDKIAQFNRPRTEWREEV